MLQYRGVDFSVSVVHYNDGPTNQFIGPCYNTVLLTSVSVVHYNDVLQYRDVDFSVSVVHYNHGPTNQFIGLGYNTVVLTLVLVWFITITDLQTSL